MADPGICYCGNYGGGKHTKSARCPESIAELRARIETHQAEWLRRVAAQCREEAKTSWANTCEMVANDIVAKDAELARLRERVGELQEANNQWGTANAQWAERERLLLEAVRWLQVELQKATIFIGYGPKEPPADLAPLIAEATK